MYESAARWLDATFRASKGRHCWAVYGPTRGLYFISFLRSNGRYDVHDVDGLIARLFHVI